MLDLEKVRSELGWAVVLWAVVGIEGLVDATDRASSHHPVLATLNALGALLAVLVAVRVAKVWKSV
jgi:hypothetical protein